MNSIIKSLPLLILALCLVHIILRADTGPSEETLNLKDAILKLHAVPDRDYRLCCEYVHETKFLDQSVASPREFKSRLELVAWLHGAKLHFIEAGNAVIIQDPAISSLTDNPFDFNRDGLKIEGTIAEIRTYIVENFQILILSPGDFPIFDATHNERRFKIEITRIASESMRI